MAVYYNAEKQTFIESDLSIEVLKEKGYMEIWLAEYNVGENKEKKLWTLMCNKGCHPWQWDSYDKKEFISGIEINEGKYCKKVSESKIESLSMVKAYLKYLQYFIECSLPDRWVEGWNIPDLKVENSKTGVIPFYLVTDLAFERLFPNNPNFNKYLNNKSENNTSVEITIPQYKCKSFHNGINNNPYYRARYRNEWEEEIDWLYYPFVSNLISLDISEKYQKINSNFHCGLTGRKEIYKSLVKRYPANYNFEFKIYNITGLSVDDIDFDNMYTSVIFLDILKRNFDQMLGKNTKAISELKNRVVKEVREVFDEELKTNEGLRNQYIKDADEIRNQYTISMEETKQKYIGEIEKLQHRMDSLSGDSRFNELKETFLKDISIIIQKSFIDFEKTLENTLSDISTKKQEIVALSKKLNTEIDEKIRQAQDRIEDIINQSNSTIKKLNEELITMEQTRNRLVSSITEEVVREVIKRNPVQEINIQLGEDDIKRKVRGIYHESFKEVLQLIHLRTPVFLVGPAGCGKNVMLKQAAKVLDLQFYYINDAREKYDLLGFVDANGKYQETQFYKAFTKGGLLMIDELDSADASVLLLLNSALGTGDDFYMTFPDGNQYQAHPDFHLVAAANTFGTGANQTYNGRNQLDGASLNRFLAVEVDYDTNIERTLVKNTDILPLYWEVRRIIRENEINYVVSTRNILNADKYLNAKTFSLDKIFKWTLIGSMTEFDLGVIISNIKTNDKYSSAFIDFVKKNYKIEDAKNKTKSKTRENNGYRYDGYGRNSYGEYGY